MKEFSFSTRPLATEAIVHDDDMHTQTSITATQSTSKETPKCQLCTDNVKVRIVKLHVSLFTHRRTRRTYVHVARSPIAQCTVTRATVMCNAQSSSIVNASSRSSRGKCAMSAVSEIYQRTPEVRCTSFTSADLTCLALQSVGTCDEDGPFYLNCPIDFSRRTPNAGASDANDECDEEDHSKDYIHLVETLTRESAEKMRNAESHCENDDEEVGKYFAIG